MEDNRKKLFLKNKINKNIGSYFEWLESFTIDDNQEYSYKKLIHKLWTMPFHGSIGNDKDREMDGLALREQYDNIVENIVGIHINDLNAAEWIADIYGKCRVLEMLIALSMRMYDLMQDMGVENSVSRWFWEIMSNVSFDILDDSVWYEYDGDRLVETNVNRIMDLDDRFEFSGRGGWFYIYDWTNMEIWYQMHKYLKKYF